MSDEAAPEIEQERPRRALTQGLATALCGVIESQLERIEDAYQAVVSRLNEVEDMAERAVRKGYDLDPYDVLDAIGSSKGTDRA